MRNRAQEKPSLHDKSLIVIVIAILVVGLIMVASASIVVSQKQFGSPFHYLLRQLCFLVLALIVGRKVVTTEVSIIERNSPYLFILSLALLCLVLIPHIGRNINGSSRWIGFGPIGLQVSELAKLSVIVYLSGYLVRKQEEIKTQAVGFVKPIIILGIVCFLLLKEPDFGASVVIILTALGMMFLAEMRLRYFIFLIVLAAAAMTLLAFSSPYRIARITSFLNPWDHAYGTGYQLTQSLIAFGKGGIWGVGLGNSVQKLFYLPESYTDFLFAVIAEELGLIGIIVTFSLYATLVIKSLLIGNRAVNQDQHFGGFCAYGIGLWLGFQFLINVGVNAGALPTKGLTLPLMSYGGSSLLIDCLALAFLFRIDFECRRKFYSLGSSLPYRNYRS